MTGSIHVSVDTEAAAKRRRVEYFAEVGAAFAAAASRTAVQRRTLRLADRTLELRFAGEVLASRLFPAFAHLEIERPAQPDLCIGLWDSADTGVALPDPSWRSGQVVRGLLSGYTGGGIRTAYERHSSGFSMFHESQQQAFFHLPDAAVMPPSESSFPLRALLNWWLCRHGRPLVHAGAVGNEQGAVLLAGMGGSGKSSTTLSCLDAGLRYIGDDFVAVDVDAGRVFSLYNSAKLFPADLDRYPRLREMVAHAGGAEKDKAVLFLHPRARDQLATGLSLRAILLPQVARGPRTRIVPVSAAAAVRRMAPSTMIHLPGSEGGELAAMARLATRWPAYALELGRDRDEIVSVIRSVLAGEGGATPA
jgi:hypothetical protein